MNIVIADDSKVLIDHLSEMLADLNGVKIIGKAEDTTSAIRLILEKQPDVAIVDIKMPGKGGIHVLEEVKTKNPTIKVIIFTNYPYHQYREKALEKGADYFFDKSGEMEKILETLKRLRDKENNSTHNVGLIGRRIEMLVKVKDFENFLENCKEKMPAGIDKVIVPTRPLEDKAYKYFSEIEKTDNIVLNSYRTVEPLRMLFYMPRMKVYPYEKKPVKRLVVGVKGCDLRSLRLLDKALINEDFIDPDYQYWRDNTYIISTDCQEAGETCHCTVLGGQPWAENNYDINLSRVDEDYVLEVGSEKGEELLALLKEHLNIEKAPDRIRELKTNQREKMKSRVADQNKDYNILDYKDLRKYPMELWQKESKDCIGCDACTNSCCSCYCIIVNDETKEGEKFTKVRSTDSCQINGYAMVAGGDTPRPHMYQRFRNRYLCKFDYMRSQFDLLGCEGCGRCIDACSAEIDIRKVVRNLAQG